MTFLEPLIRDLRERKLWPVAVALLVAVVAVPLLLAKSAPAPTPAPVPSAAAAPLPGAAVPAVSVMNVTAHSRLRGTARDPFSQQKLAGAKASSTTAATATATGQTAAAAAHAAGAAAAGGSAPTGAGSNAGGSGGGTGTGAPAPHFPAPAAKPAPAGLTAKQSYAVSFAITNAAGGLDTFDPLERLSAIPSNQEPLLVELGVLEGGHRVLFVVQPGTVVSGPGSCIPGPIDCEVLSLSPGQIENLGAQGTTAVDQVGEFAVTAIYAAGHPTVAAADKARRAESGYGRRLLARSPLQALPLFQYKPALGVVVDLRNLTVRGS